MSTTDAVERDIAELAARVTHASPRPSTQPDGKGAQRPTDRSPAEVQLRALRRGHNRRVTHISRVLYEFRVSRNMTAVTLAKMLGITTMHLCNLEAGRNTVRAPAALSMAKKLNADAAGFLKASLLDIAAGVGFDGRCKIEVT